MAACHIGNLKQLCIPIPISQGLLQQSYSLLHPSLFSLVLTLTNRSPLGDPHQAGLLLSVRVAYSLLEWPKPIKCLLLRLVLLRQSYFTLV